MKTIFVTIFEGVEVKNILRTPILENLLKEKDIQIVLFTKSKEKVSYYQKEFSDPRLIFEYVEWKQVSKIDRFFAKLKFVLLKTESTDLKRKMLFEINQKKLSFVYGKILNTLLARSFFRKIARRLDFLLVSDSTYVSFFQKYKPDLVFLAHLFDEPEISLLREAKKQKVKTVGFVNSWDKVTARCIMRLLPDKAVVFNSFVRDELIEFNEMKSEDIFISGLPQYDYFYSYDPISKEEFCQKKNLSSEKEIIVYASMGRAFSSLDWDMIDFMYELIKSSYLVKSCELLVRFQPNDFVDEEELKKRPSLIFDVPGIRFGTKRGVDWDMNQTDLNNLVDTLKNMSVLVCYASSISIDASVFDKPVININFDINPPSSLLKSPTQYYKTLHYKKALKTNALGLVSNKDQLIKSINDYLKNPSLKRKERKLLVEEQCSFTDGASGKRISRFMLDFINNGRI